MIPDNFDPLGLYPYQRQIFDAVADSIVHGRGLTFSVEIARQGGKNQVSACLEAALLVHFVGLPLNVVKCAPTFEPQAVISLRRLRDVLDASEFAGDYIVESGHIVRLGQARVIFLSASENANVVGNTAHLLLEIDEAQDVSIDKFDRDFRPMAATRNATTVLYGTPWRQGNLLDAIKKRNLELERADGVKRHFHFDWEEVGRYNDSYRAYVEGERARLGADHPTFRSQYQLLEVGKGGGFFSDDHLVKLTGDFPRQRTAQPRAVYVAGRLQLYSRDSSPDCEECWRQLESACADYKSNQNLNFYCDPSRSHDDFLISLALAVKAAIKYEPRSAVGRVSNVG
ncbi:MAG: hypothetical protein TUN42_02115 [Dehalogenimonas sp.]